MKKNKIKKIGCLVTAIIFLGVILVLPCSASGTDISVCKYIEDDFLLYLTEHCEDLVSYVPTFTSVTEGGRVHTYLADGVHVIGQSDQYSAVRFNLSSPLQIGHRYFLCAEPPSSSGTGYLSQSYYLSLSTATSVSYNFNLDATFDGDGIFIDYDGDQNYTRLVMRFDHTLANVEYIVYPHLFDVTVLTSGIPLADCNNGLRQSFNNGLITFDNVPEHIFYMDVFEFPQSQQGIDDGIYIYPDGQNPNRDLTMSEFSVYCSSHGLFAYYLRPSTDGKTAWFNPPENANIHSVLLNFDSDGIPSVPTNFTIFGGNSSNACGLYFSSNPVYYGFFEGEWQVKTWNGSIEFANSVNNSALPVPSLFPDYEPCLGEYFLIVSDIPLNEYVEFGLIPLNIGDDSSKVLQSNIDTFVNAVWIESAKQTLGAVNTSSTVLADTVFAIITAPGYLINSLLDFTVFGINFANVVKVLITLSFSAVLVYWSLKLIRG